jgi:hypothetical protein
MKMHDSVIEPHTVLRMMLSAGVLAVLLLACAGTAAGGTTRVVDDDGGAGCVGVQIVAAAVDAAIDGDLIEVWGGSYV